MINDCMNNIKQTLSLKHVQCPRPGLASCCQVQQTLVLLFLLLHDYNLRTYCFLSWHALVGMASKSRLASLSSSVRLSFLPDD